MHIDDLARLMVRLMGLEVKSEANPEGDVAITYTGLKHGEKPYEELLVGANLAKTEHPRIRRLDEPFLSQAELDRELELLEAAMKKRNVKSIQAVLPRTVEGCEAKMHAHEGNGRPFAVWAPHSPALH